MYFYLRSYESARRETKATKKVLFWKKYESYHPAKPAWTMAVKGSKNSYEDFGSEIMTQWQANRL